MTTRVYVGGKGSFREVFKADDRPTQQSYGHLYTYSIGPFRTVRGAKAMVHYGGNNPHVLTVNDAERVGKQYADALKPLALSKR